MCAVWRAVIYAFVRKIHDGASFLMECFWEFIKNSLFYQKSKLWKSYEFVVISLILKDTNFLYCQVLIWGLRSPDQLTHHLFYLLFPITHIMLILTWDLIFVHFSHFIPGFLTSLFTFVAITQGKCPITKPQY